MMKDLVSVVVPAYQAEKHIQKCLDSLCNQTYKALEIIIVDDGSKDHTADICKTIAQQDERVHVYTQSNAGPSVARNLGIEMAHGKYLYFMDSDDHIEPDTVEYMVQFMDVGSDLIAVSFANLNSNGEYLSGVKASDHEYTLNNIRDKATFLVNCFLKYRIGFEVWNKMYRMDIVKSQRCHFIEGIHYAEDVYFNLSYLVHAKKISSSSKVCYKREVRSGSLSSAEKNNLHINETVTMAKEIQKLYLAIDEEWVQYFYFVYNEMMNDSYLRVKRFGDLKAIIKQCSVKQQMHEFQKWAVCHIAAFPKFYGLKQGAKYWIKALMLYGWCKV